MQCSNNLKQIGLALHNYHDAYGTLPPAYVSDKNGNPLYSWRVLILPYMEQEQLYRQFHLDEPWDSPHNLDLARQMPAAFGCPSQRLRLAYSTTYVAITGEEMLWTGAKSLSFDEIPDGRSNTLLVVEWSESDVIWTEPRDLPLKEIEKWWFVSLKVRQGKQRHRDGVNAVFADGSVRFLKPHRLNGRELRSLLTPAGNDAVIIDQFK